MPDAAALRTFAAGRWADPALAAALAAVALAELAVRSDIGEANPAAASVLVVMLVAPVAWWRTHPLWAVLVQAAVLLVLPAAVDASPPMTVVAVIALLAYSVGARERVPAGLLALLVLAAALQVATGFKDAPNLEILFFTAIPWWVGHEVARRSRLVRRLGERTRELEAEEAAFARLSVQRERARIARELHDVASHHLAVVVIQGAAGRMSVSATPADTRARLTTIGESSREALADMSRLVQMLGSGADGDGAGGGLAPLLARARRAGPEVRVTPLPRGTTLPAAVEDAACRVVQEALTNAMKHAAGAPVEVRLALDDDLMIEVRNGEGVTRAPALVATGSGIGLAGMRERLDALGGSLSAGPEAEGGWCVRARVPVVGTA